MFVFPSDRFHSLWFILLQLLPVTAQHLCPSMLSKRALLLIVLPLSLLFQFSAHSREWFDIILYAESDSDLFRLSPDQPENTRSLLHGI